MRITRSLADLRTFLPAVILATALVVSPAAAQDTARFLAFTRLTNACLTNFLNNTDMLRSAIAAGVGIRTICECAAEVFVAGTGYADLAAIAAGSPLSQTQQAQHAQIATSCAGVGPR